MRSRCSSGLVPEPDAPVITSKRCPRLVIAGGGGGGCRRDGRRDGIILLMSESAGKADMLDRMGKVEKVAGKAVDIQPEILEHTTL